MIFISFPPSTATAMDTSIRIASRFPAMGTTIFTVMSRLAAECGAVNLSQGFPDFQADASLFDAVHRHMTAGHNQYAPMAGTPELRQAIVDKVAALYGPRFDAESEVTVTAGATQAIFTAIAAFVRPGDEVIVFAPVYDSYVPAIETVGGRAVVAHLRFPDYAPDWAEVAQADHAEDADDRHQFAAQPDRQPADRGRPRRSWPGSSAAATSSSFPTRSTSTSSSTASATPASAATRNSRRAASSSPASARPTTSPAGRSATSSARRR